MSAISEFDQRLKFVKNRMDELDQLRTQGDWPHVYDVLSSIQRELLLCLMDAGYIKELQRTNL